MKRDFEDDESFELFIQNKVEHYKMYPSEVVWKGIHNALHTRRRWFTIGGSLLLLTAVIFLTQEFLLPGSSATVVKKPAVQTSRSLILSQLQAAPNTELAETGYASAQGPVKATASHVLPGRHQPFVNLTKTTGSRTAKMAVNQAPVEHGGIDMSAAPVSVPGQAGSEADPADKPAAGKLANEPAYYAPAVTATIPLATPVSGDIIKKADESSTDKVEEVFSGKINWLQELALIKLTPVKKSRFNLQFYFSPTVSYRKLTDNKVNTAQQNIPIALNHASIDRYVDHVPSVGLELGSNILYSAFGNLTLKTGLQLNYSRYNIKAYSFYYQKASIALNRGLVADTITAYTSIRNFNGYSKEELQNQYLQLSLPVGAEYKLLGNKRLQLNIAGTIQPTYLLFNDTYLLSMDYVNYAKQASLVRKWNIHSSVEAFVSYKTGGIRWQMGPQFRYQLMSSYNDTYPIKEYLMEYGFKIGVSKTINTKTK